MCNLANKGLIEIVYFKNNKDYTDYLRGDDGRILLYEVEKGSHHLIYNHFKYKKTGG